MLIEKASKISGIHNMPRFAPAVDNINSISAKSQKFLPFQTFHFQIKSDWSKLLSSNLPMDTKVIGPIPDAHPVLYKVDSELFV